MALPLPRIVPDVLPGGGIATSMQGLNALERSRLENEIRRAQAKYAEQTAYADAASKIAYANMLPYQIQATVMSNPMLWQFSKEHPEVLQDMASNLMKSVPTSGNIFGNIPMPQPGSRTNPLGQGLMGMLLNKLFGNQQQQSQVAGTSPQQNIQPPGGGIIPSSQQEPPKTLPPTKNAEDIVLAPPTSPAGQVSTQMTTKYQQTPYTEGKPLRTETGEVVSTPTGSTVSQIQQSYLALQNSLPVLDSVAEKGEKILSSGQLKNVSLSRLNNILDQWGVKLPDWVLKKVSKLFNIDPKAIDDYAKWRADRIKAVEGLMGGLSLPNNIPSLQDVHSLVDPLPGESGSAYAKRIRDEKNYLLNTRLPQYKKMLGSGMGISSGNKSKYTDEDIKYTAKKYGITEEEVKRSAGI